ncbi:MAG: hypothetical protein LBV41_02555 [Cytophagaceae bacterium]|jgi:hypothetical protein|nr:hypothetical protein [Cytophagaceae bacterium]
MQAKRSLRETDNSTAVRKGRTSTFTSVLPLRAGRYERHFPQATLRFDKLSDQLACGYEYSAFSRLFCVT